MSRAFVTEQAPTAPPPERMIDDGPNPVTAEGKAQIDAHVVRIEAAMAAEKNVLLRETLARDLRYWTARQASATLAPPPSGDVAAFGATVTIQRAGRSQRFRIVGADEADATKGLISVRAPLAAAVIGAGVGDIVESPSLGEIEILAVEA